MVYAQMYEEHDHHHGQIILHEAYMVYVPLTHYEEYIIRGRLHLSFYRGMGEQGDLIILVSLSEEKNTYNSGLKRQKDQYSTILITLSVSIPNLQASITARYPVDEWASVRW